MAFLCGCRRLTKTYQNLCGSDRSEVIGIPGFLRKTRQFHPLQAVQSGLLPALGGLGDVGCQPASSSIHSAICWFLSTKPIKVIQGALVSECTGEILSLAQGLCRVLAAEMGVRTVQEESNNLRPRKKRLQRLPSPDSNFHQLKMTSLAQPSSTRLQGAMIHPTARWRRPLQASKVKN